MVILDQIPECEPQKLKKRALEDVSKIIIHRCDVAENATRMAEAFRSIPETGGWMPYTFVVRRDGGIIDQALPVNRVGPHARGYNGISIGIAVVGDFRKEAPTAEQMRSLVSLCAAWQSWLNVDIYGHMELPNSSRDPTKKCPGKYFDMEALRQEVQRRVASDALGHIRFLGCILDRAECSDTLCSLERDTPATPH